MTCEHVWERIGLLCMDGKAAVQRRCIRCGEEALVEVPRAEEAA